jgi:SnoaL-like polyketide cyclase
MDPFVALMRRYVVDYTNRHDTSVCAEIMEPGYTLRMGPHVVAGRDDAYIPASVKQFTRFPGLGLTVHEIVTNGDRLAMRFSEHGASVRDAGAAASWAGIGLYRWNGERLVDNSVEQDYLARHRQLTDGVPDAVAPPAVAPWDTAPIPADPAAEAAVRGWIAAGLPAAGIHWDDGDDHHILDDDAESQVDDLFSAGEQVAFRLTMTGRYADGSLPSLGADYAGLPATLHLVALVRVAGGEVVGGHGVRDRLGLGRALLTS